MRQRQTRQTDGSDVKDSSLPSCYGVVEDQLNSQEIGIDCQRMIIGLFLLSFLCLRLARAGLRSVTGERGKRKRTAFVLFLKTRSTLDTL